MLSLKGRSQDAAFEFLSRGDHMASAAEAQATLESAIQIIRAERQAANSCKARFTAAKNTLVNLPTTLAEGIAIINGYNATTGTDSEKHAKALLAALQTEFVALRTAVTAAETALASISFEAP